MRATYSNANAKLDIFEIEDITLLAVDTDLDLEVRRLAEEPTLRGLDARRDDEEY
jgi:hypothetical protein